MNTKLQQTFEILYNIDVRYNLLPWVYGPIEKLARRSNTGAVTLCLSSIFCRYDIDATSAVTLLKYPAHRRLQKGCMDVKLKGRSHLYQNGVSRQEYFLILYIFLKYKGYTLNYSHVKIWQLYNFIY